MLFKPYHIPQIRSGSKTVTRREWKTEYNGPLPGRIHPATTELFVPKEACDCWIRVTDRYEQPLGDIDDEDAQREGDYGSREEFIEGYEAVYGEGAWQPEKTVHVVEFEYLHHLTVKCRIDQHRRGERPPVEFSPDEVLP